MMLRHGIGMVKDFQWNVLCAIFALEYAKVLQIIQKLMMSVREFL